MGLERRWKRGRRRERGGLGLEKKEVGEKKQGVGVKVGKGEGEERGRNGGARGERKMRREMTFVLSHVLEGLCTYV